ncbi:stationary phase survival protein SurE [Thermosipho africanus H17ap60334]|jgi:5'-nucleotidase|uniref:5'-nucleotidase SurE n=1 Tax=Thermosipho africanus (strain TCF52B) TaxID=484019 RepID=SURE_THEAB|nr:MULTISPECIES: 5'/3'-nucleotidase SurE [Thermosipho]B7IH68.1 RecName: Full=5'-nucleotidase SurE; AltName: Full=Nucleoside 5'-monophosphate phosphohydrolase [Thermosipho africanus TCF52B]HCF38004.1 5'-nucleotidase SurE [Thermosipho africanus]ACJ75432.1 5'/3'-nucleotidase SurE [Thermosipho africanus TCF52B]EKF50090.1 stationary phase survival protein SurE [Thermosipho africanus H17ap60334]MBZ4650944.1 surE [Thermosipho sp. (in: thermotogales)]MDK2899733.1 5/3-nucleotidase [Thermosipho sp. (in
MNILVTNDDGVTADGILCLARTLSKKYKVTVVAPETEQSAVGHAITLRLPLWLRKLDINENFEIYSVSGTPADCVKMGIDVVLGEKPDLLISGINRGNNLGTDVVYSGTVSGALEGAIAGVPSIAVSSYSFENPMYETAAKFILDFLEEFDVRSIPRFTALNINVPSVPYDQIKGWKLTRQSKRMYDDYFEKRVDPSGGNYYWMMGTIIEDDPDPKADYKAIAENYVSVTPISVFLTNEEYLKRLEERYEDKTIR